MSDTVNHVPTYNSRYDNVVDEKRRIQIPAKWREEGETEFMLILWPNGADKDACLMVGIDVRRITRITAAISAALCGLAAGAIAPLFDLYPNMGTDLVFKSFAVVIIGGMGNVAGSVVAGLLLGVAESFAGGLVSTGLRDGIGFTLMIVMLLARPQGLFGKSVRV